uniref:Uncharacterized protein n=1 Tax=viral metagenome TaxID=1070528 RepID=A0A6M3KPL5_9ZZZZ
MGYSNVKISTEQGGSVLNVEDGALVKFGDSDDVKLGWSTTSTDRLLISATTNNTRFDIGTAALSFDIYLYGSASTAVWDASANTLDFNGADFNLQDDDMLALGDSNDATIAWATTSTDRLKIAAAANNTRFDIGTAALSFDLYLYGSAGTVIWDASGNSLTMSAGSLALDASSLDLNNSTNSVQFYLAPTLSTANVGPGGFRMYTNSTGAILAVNTTGTTWNTMALH